jgi:plastocyanin
MKFTFCLFVFVLSSICAAKDIRMVQVDKVFLGDITDKQAAEAFDNADFEEKHKVQRISAKVGDTIQFINRDDVAHNVSGLLGKAVSFDVKLQEPGLANDRKIPLSTKGEYTIQCAIHPKMTFKLNVD